ncbi:glycosyl hydrolase family 61-domain-containing protein [Emericellopsis atlantica]|uniref:lytic cellulose monooxygenase (C4-dehydrogenating) n=1 Tax=Emericellopsis atlantica TaxID=2614577 RepID=A0A9P7ZLV9_9HYPO|nr:glycosyl hydrolase family 61-domain-containing protein [Emericellopsis atlantica]KAG9254499.1 glycosyl hydrolase family 61-domain-containing protein [Emericellopsis atlantica]
MISALATLAMASSVAAHATMYGVWVNGEDQGDGRNVYIRTPPNNSPVKDLASPDLVCNVNGAKVAPEFVSAAAGDTLSFEWQHDNRNDDIIDGSHQGPIITWVAAFTEDDGTGPIWTKVAEDGFDGTQWAVDKIKANNGKQDFTIPAALAPGKYLFRQEIIAHHESDTAFEDNPARGAQFYPSCVQIEVSGDGDAVPDQGFDFNVDYTYQDPGIVFNLYNFDGTYDIPGPEVWSAEGGSGSPAEPSTAPEPTTAPEPSTAPEPTPSAPVESTPAPSITTLSTVVVPTSAVTEPTATAAPETPAPEAPEEGCKLKRRSRKSKRSAKARRASRMA